MLDRRELRWRGMLVYRWSGSGRHCLRRWWCCLRLLLLMLFLLRLERLILLLFLLLLVLLLVLLLEEAFEGSLEEVDGVGSYARGFR